MSDPIKTAMNLSFCSTWENGNPNGDPDAGNMPWWTRRPALALSPMYA